MFHNNKLDGLKIYVIMYCVPYEFSEIKGIFSSYKKAKEFREEIIRLGKDPEEYEIEVWKINKRYFEYI